MSGSRTSTSGWRSAQLPLGPGPGSGLRLTRLGHDEGGGILTTVLQAVGRPFLFSPIEELTQRVAMAIETVHFALKVLRVDPHVLIAGKPPRIKHPGHVP